MEPVTHCRLCGRVMENKKIDNSRMKMTCSCGFGDFRSITAKLYTVNPFRLEAGFVPFTENENGKAHLTTQKANREHQEIITLEEISMLVSTELNLHSVLQQIVERVARQLQVNVCSIYLMEGEELVLAATHGFDPAFIGKIRIKVGEGITGAVARDKGYINLANASQDPRYKRFPQLREDRFNSMLSFPIMAKNHVYGVINCNSTPMKTFHDDSLYFVSIITNLIVVAIKLSQKAAAERIPRPGNLPISDINSTVNKIQPVKEL